MFSFFSSKKKHSPGDSPEDTSQPPIPRAEDDFVVVNQGKEQPGAPYALYPSINPQGQVMPSYPSHYGQPPGATVPQLPKKEVNFLQGVPFSLSKELASNTNNDMASIHLSEIMAYVTRRLQVEPVDYDFSVEKSVLLEDNC